MSISTLEAQKHLDNMSELNKNSILTMIGNRPLINPFVVYCIYIYFIKCEKLVCVELQEQNGVFFLWFDNQYIEFDRMSGNCFIVNFSRNYWEYFSVGDHYQNGNPNVLHCFLYKLLIQERINRVSGRTIRSIRFHFTPNCVVGHLERAGGSTLKVPNDCLSIHEMICGIKQFMMAQITSSFMRLPNFFLRAIQDVQRAQCSLSVSGKYGVGMFLQTQFDKRLPAFGMMSKLMMKLFVGFPEKGYFEKSVATGFLRYMSSSILPRLCMDFTKNPIRFRDAIPELNDLFDSYHLKTRLVSNCGFPISISSCVKDMMDALRERDESCEERRRKELEEYCRIEEEKRQIEASIQEFRNGLKEVDTEFQKTKRRVNELNKICEDSPKKKPKLE
jgi:hypothetical protein